MTLGRGFERDFSQGEYSKLGRWGKAARLLTLPSCLLSIFSSAASNLNINRGEFSYKEVEHKSSLKTNGKEELQEVNESTVVGSQGKLLCSSAAGVVNS